MRYVKKERKKKKTIYFCIKLFLFIQHPTEKMKALDYFVYRFEIFILLIINCLVKHICKRHFKQYTIRYPSIKK